MRRIGVVIAIAMALIASSFMLGTAGATDRDRWRGGMKFLSVTDQSTDVDVGEEGYSQGDYFVFHDKVYRLKRHRHHSRHKREVGELNGQCTTTYLTEAGGTGQCLVTASLRDGDLTVQGVFRFSADEESGPDEATMAVTGGTGEYAGAGGEVHVRFLSDTKTIIWFDLN